MYIKTIIYTKMTWCVDNVVSLGWMIAVLLPCPRLWFCSSWGPFRFGASSLTYLFSSLSSGLPLRMLCTLLQPTLFPRRLIFMDPIHCLPGPAPSKWMGPFECLEAGCRVHNYLHICRVAMYWLHLSPESHSSCQAAFSIELFSASKISKPGWDKLRG